RTGLGGIAVAAVVLAAQNPQVPIFRGGANLVLVDAYPRKDGHVVEGLTPKDFTITEDGVPQVVEQFEFVRVEPATEDERRDPRNQKEMLQAAADPHDRVFVMFLDTYHVTQAASRRARAPLINLLEHVLGPGDMVGLTTPKFGATDLVLGRKLTVIDDQLMH